MKLTDLDPRRILVVGHDAGGAAYLASWLKHSLDFREVRYLLQGPALAHYQQSLGIITHYSDLKDIDLDDYEVVLSSTSGSNSDLERQTVQAAQQRCFVIMCLDHWVNYALRLQYRGARLKPNEIWVFDDDAEALARQVFPEIRIIKKKNYYLQDAQKSIKAIESLTDANVPQQALRVLYVCEPSYDPRYSEFEVLDAVLSFLLQWHREKPAHDPRHVVLRLRLHPREEQGKYDKILADAKHGLTDHGLTTEISTALELAQDIAWSDWVLGCQTMAMVVALAADKHVLSVLPAQVAQMALPHKEIKRLFPPS